MRCYVETNALIRAGRERISGFSLRDRLAARGWTPVVGSTTVMELERGFANAKLRARVVRQFQVLRDLGPEWLMSPKRLDEAELHRWKTGESPSVFLSQAEAMNPVSRVQGYAKGIPDPRSAAIERMIHRNRSARRADGQQFVDLMNAMRQKEPRILAAVKTKEQAAHVLGLHSVNILREVLFPGMDFLEAERIASALDRLLYFGARVRRLEYVAWIIVKDRKVPKRDKYDDSGHLAEAAYCDGILSGDNGLLGPMREYVSPQLTPVHMDKIAGWPGDGWARWR